MLKGIEVFQLYHAINLHFTSENYDYFQYNGKTSNITNLWYQRSDKMHFEKLGKYHSNTLIKLFVSFLISQPDHSDKWGKPILHHFNSTQFANWQGKMDALNKHFQNDMDTLISVCQQRNLKMEQLLKPRKQTHPLIIELLLADKLLLETVVIINELTKFVDKVDNKIDNDPVWNQNKHLIKKYQRFFNIDKPKYQQMFKQAIENVDQSYQNAL